ncbi:MAG TPA: glycosyl hydrolase [Chthoniobacterales bacterium]|nr:glycosyl hydrolase [Chthoniobacterales bacterium]
MVLVRCAIVIALSASSVCGGQLIAPPPAGKLYQGLYFDEPQAGHDPTEHDVTAADVARFEETLGTKTTWIFFSNNWFESRTFPRETCDWIRGLGKIPYVRLMLRSDTEQDRPEKLFTLEKILGGQFDEDLKTWARDAKQFGSPVLVEWGTEPNGSWFSWNGKWNGGAKEGPARYVAAYRHIVDLMRAEGADNLQWVWHVNWLDQPEAKWNRFENYYPGDSHADWVALSAYGPLTPRAVDGTESFRFKMATAYPRLTKIAAGKPIVIAEFGCALHHRRVDASAWAKSALDDLFSGRWPAVIGFCWWNESWENDDVRKHNTDMNILHDAELTKVWREELAKHADKIQPVQIMGPSS